jgi:tetratricopeptide (TPR) repeat protein
MDERFIKFAARQYEAARVGQGKAADECPDENTWALLADNALSPSEREALIQHISGCPLCRRTASEIISEWEVMPAMPRRWIFRLHPMAYAAAAVLLLGLGSYFIAARVGTDQSELLARAGRYVADGQYEAAERELAAAMARGATGPEIKRLRGQALLGAALATTHPGRGRLTELGLAGILQRRTKAISAMPVSEPRLRQALQLFQEVAEALPMSASGWRELGAALILAGDFDQAATTFEHWVQIDPGAAAAHNACGLALYGAARYAEAAVSFERAVVAAPDLATYELNAAIACEEAGQLEAAKRHWKGFLELEPTGPEADEARKWLAELERQVP